ncbi:MAG TPA: phosphoglycerate dehydrogenase [Longimicrobiales bacterium]|nr:phosphoglycerate dehydrogenase [Longimicrobiales bacterium]
MTQKFAVLIADAINAAALQPLQQDGRFTLIEKPGLKGEDLARAIEGVDAVVVRSGTRITRESLKYASQLKVIGRAGVGVDNIDVEAATELGVAVLNAPSGNTISAAELTLALLLALVRKLPAADRSMRAGEWDRKSFSGIELYGKTLGLVGAGRIGSEVARRARAFGMHVVAYDPYLTAERAAALDIEQGTLPEVLQRADVVSLHVPLTEATANLIGAREFELLKPSAFIVNAARGGVINEAALHEALSKKRIAGAAFDVFEQEPLPADHPLRSLPNVVLTPHLGAATAEAQQNVAIEIAEAVRAALIEGDFSRAVNAPAIGGDEMRKMRPLLALAERLGVLAAAMTDGAPERVELRYAGLIETALRPITSAALIGVLAEAVGKGAVNFVNAIHLAEARGIQVERSRIGAQRDYGEYIELRLSSKMQRTMVAGALLSEAHARVVRIDGFYVDVQPRDTLVVLRNRDVPGVIGRVGTVLGNSGINIAEYHQARMEAGGDALAAVTVDGKVPHEVIEQLRALPEVHDVRQANLE